MANRKQSKRRTPHRATDRAIVSVARSLALPVALTSVFALAACTVEPPTTNFGPQDAGFQDDTSTFDIVEGEAVVVPTMDGTWLHFDQVSTCVNLGTPLEFEQLTSYLHVVTVDQGALGGVVESWQACNVDLSALFGLKPAADESLYDVAFPMTSYNGLVDSTQVGGIYSSGSVVTVWGIDFEDREADAFPEDENDPRIIDADSNGEPGITLSFSGTTECVAHMIQRATNHFTGTFVEPDRIEGTVVGNTQQSIVDATGLCGTQYIPRMNNIRNRFTRIRVDGQGGAINLDANGDGEFTCDEVLPAAAQLFDPLPYNHNCCLLEGGGTDRAFPLCPDGVPDAE